MEHLVLDRRLLHEEVLVIGELLLDGYISMARKGK